MLAVIDEIDGGDTGDGNHAAPRAALLLEPGTESIEIMPVAAASHRREILGYEATCEVPEQGIPQDRAGRPY